MECAIKAAMKSGKGAPKLVEGYPAASLKSWGLGCRGYKLIDERCNLVRKKILEALRKKLPWLHVENEYAEDSDALDSLVASLTARAAALGLTAEYTQVANTEGWIHVSKELPRL